jgi:hypothetical protein
MTLRGSLARFGIASLAVGLLLGCSDDTGGGADSRADGGRDFAGERPPPPPCSLKIKSLNGRAVASVNKLTDADDQDNSKPGIQVDVEVTATNPPAGDIKLNVTGLSPDLSLPAAPSLTFKGVTIGSALTTVAITAYATGCNQDSVTLGVQPPPECVFLDPPDGATLSKKQDKNPATATFEYDVKVHTSNAGGGQVTLSVGTSTPSAPKAPGAAGDVTFADTVLTEEIGLVLKAEVMVGGTKRSCQAKVNVSTGAPKCKLLGFTPPPITTSKGKAGLGIAQDANKATPGIETDVEVETEAIPGMQVTLFAGTSVKKSVTLGPGDGGLAKLKQVELADGETEIEASCATPSGVSTKSTKSPLVVDSKAPEAVTTLICVVANNREGQVSCTWNSVADPPGGSGVEAYDVRYSVDTALGASNWDTATAAGPITAFPAPLPHTFQLKNLKLGRSYYFGLKGIDFVKNATAVALPQAPGDALAVDFKAQERALATASGWGAVMAAGDFDCDGFTDLAVGDPAAESGKGKVYIYLGSKNGLSVNPVKILNGTVAGAAFGARLASLANFNGDTDGCVDLAVLASHNDSKDGKVYLYLGRKLFFDREDVTTGLGAELVLALPASATATQWLGAIASAGDLDGDGLTDLAVSWLDTGSADAATLYVVYGDKALAAMGPGKTPASKELPAAAGVQVTGGKASESFGLSLGAGAQLDADSYSELLIGAKDALVSGAKHGVAFVVKGAARAATLPETIAVGSSARAIKIAGGSASVAFGTALAFVGDMDKDGNRELAVGDPGAASGAGAVHLFNLKTTPASVADAVATVANDLASPAGNAFGGALGDAAVYDTKAGADLQADGLADLIAAAKAKGAVSVGAVFQIGGGLSGLATSKAAYTWSGPAAAPSYGAVVIMAKDINGDGYVDLVIGDPQASGGKGRLFAYY